MKYNQIYNQKSYSCIIKFNIIRYIYIYIDIIQAKTYMRYSKHAPYIAIISFLKDPYRSRQSQSKKVFQQSFKKWKILWNSYAGFPGQYIKKFF